MVHQPAAFCGGIAEMRKKEGYDTRDMFAGGLIQSCKRMSVICEQLLGFIAGKMTPLMQLTSLWPSG